MQGPLSVFFQSLLTSVIYLCHHKWKHTSKRYEIAHWLPIIYFSCSFVQTTFSNFCLKILGGVSRIAVKTKKNNGNVGKMIFDGKTCWNSHAHLNVVGCGNKISNLLKIEKVFAAVFLHISRNLIHITWNIDLNGINRCRWCKHKGRLTLPE